MEEGTAVAEGAAISGSVATPQSVGGEVAAREDSGAATSNRLGGSCEEMACDASIMVWVATAGASVDR